MKISIASPSTGTQKSFDIDDEKKLVQIHEKRISQEFSGDVLGDQFKGYVLKITGGQDKEGFPMKQGVLTNCRVRLLLKRGDVGYQAWRGRKGERRRKSVRGCIVAGDIALLNCIIIKEGPEKIEGLNDHVIPRRLGPKRANKIRKLFNLTKQDDVRKYVIRRYLPPKEGKDGKMRRGRSKAPKIQRLVTPVVIERWRRRKRERLAQRHKMLKQKKDYLAMLAKRKKVSARRKKCLLLAALATQRRRELRKLGKAVCKKVKKHEKIRAKREAERALEAKTGKLGKRKREAAKMSATRKEEKKKLKKESSKAEAAKKKKTTTQKKAPATAPASASKPATAPAAAAAAKKPAAPATAAKPKPKPVAKAAKPSAKPEGKKAAPAAKPSKPQPKKAASAKPEGKKAPAAAKKAAKPEGKKSGGK